MSVSSNISTRESSVTFNCYALGGPDNTYVWMKNEMIIRNGTTLVVTDIDASSGGTYTCFVSNAAGNDSASTTLYVAPYIVTQLEEETLLANGSNVNINCNAAGFPAPNVQWVDMINQEVSKSALLQFSPVVFGDEGLYRCVATADIDGVTFIATNETTLIGMKLISNCVQIKSILGSACCFMQINGRPINQIIVIL